MNPITGEVTPIELADVKDMADRAGREMSEKMKAALKPGALLADGRVVVSERVAMMAEDARRYRDHREKRRRRRKIARATRRAQR